MAWPCLNHLSKRQKALTLSVLFFCLLAGFVSGAQAPHGSTYTWHRSGWVKGRLVVAVA